MKNSGVHTLIFPKGIEQHTINLKMICFMNGDDRIIGVPGVKFYVAIHRMVSFQCSFSINEGHHNLPRVGFSRFTHNDIISIFDMIANHRIAFHLQHKIIRMNKGLRYGYGFGIFQRFNGFTCGNKT